MNIAWACVDAGLTQRSPNVPASRGRIGNILVGIVGAVLGGFLFTLVGITAGGLIGSIITATVGAIVLLYIVSIVKKA